MDRYRLLHTDNGCEFFSILCPGFHQRAQTQGQSLDFYIGLEGLREAEYVQNTPPWISEHNL